MQVGVLQFFDWRDRKIPLENIYARALERVRIMATDGPQSASHPAST